MPRLPRFVPPSSMVELTTRTNGSQLLLKPCPALNERVLGIIGRALALHPIELHAFVFLSTHWHALATVCAAERLSAFLRHVNGNLARAVHDIHGWTGKVWGRRTQVIPVLDDAAAEGRLRYILAHGAKEGLVASPYDWPGVSSVRALAFGEELVGIWHDRGREARLRRRGPAPRAEVLRPYPIPLTPIPSWAGLTPSARQAAVRQLIADIERNARREHPTVLGPTAIRGQDPTTTQSRLVASPAPAAHATRIEARRLYLTARREFVVAYRASTTATSDLARSLAAHYPPGSSPSRPPHAPVPIGQAVVPVVSEPPLWHAAAPDHPRDGDHSPPPPGRNRTSPWAKT